MVCSPENTLPPLVEVSAFSRVVITTDTHAGATPPFAFTTFSAISVNRWIADAGTGEPGTGPVEASLIINLAHPLSDSSRLGLFVMAVTGSSRSDRLAACRLWQ
jgi:hypothetical protein